jgi:hypothetical protein
VFADVSFFPNLNGKPITMGAIKANEYTSDEWDVSIIARAISHPARVKMIKQLKHAQSYRNIDFSKLLGMTKSTVKEHLDKLDDADLINITYLPHCYIVSLKAERIGRLEQWLRTEL